MATNCFGSIKGKVMRVVRLNECGVPVVGAKSVVVSDGFIKVDLSPEYEDGEEFTVKNAWGDLCINEQDAPRLKSLGAAIDFCKVDPDLFEIVTGARLLLSGTDAHGYVLNGDPPDGRFSLEVWSKVPGVGGCAGGTASWVYWLLPNLGLGRLGDVTVENGPVTFSLSGTSAGAPAGAWNTTEPFGATTSYLPGTEVLVAGDHFANNITTKVPPTAACGAIALAA